MQRERERESTCISFARGPDLTLVSTAVARFHSQTVELKNGGEWEIVDSSEAVAAAEEDDAAQIGALIPNGSTPAA